MRIYQNEKPAQWPEEYVIPCKDGDLHLKKTSDGSALLTIGNAQVRMTRSSLTSLSNAVSMMKFQVASEASL